MCVCVSVTGIGQVSSDPLGGRSRGSESLMRPFWNLWSPFSPRRYRPQAGVRTNRDGPCAPGFPATSHRDLFLSAPRTGSTPNGLALRFTTPRLSHTQATLYFSRPASEHWDAPSALVIGRKVSPLVRLTWSGPMVSALGGPRCLK